ncbi:MAG: 16S rRNA (cytidine(1402)-2'-O)-methyltransferase [Natronospirillum sp.]
MSEQSTQLSVPALYIVATPIGNRDDITLRALTVLRSVDRILAEDTRHSQHLLQHYDINRPLVSVHEHNEAARLTQIVQWLEAGESLALITDAGTPLISDPGFVLVRALRERGLKVIPIPGVSAVITALCAAGLPTDRFQFIGFLPAKSGPRERTLTAALAYRGTSLCYESPRRLLDTLKILAELAPERPLVVARELTKQFETFLSGTAVELVAQVEADSDQQRGEMVLLIHGQTEDVLNSGVDADALLTLLAEHMPPKKAAGEAARLLGGSKNDLYARLLAQKSVE